MWRLFLLLLLALLATYQKAWAQPVIHQPAVYTQCKEVPTPAGFLPPTGEQVVYCKLGGAGWCSMNASGVETCTGGSGGGGGVTSITAGTGISLSPNPIIATGTVSLTIPVATANGGTNQTTAPNNATLVGNGTNWTEPTFPDCHAAGATLNFTAATNLFSCNTAIAATTVPFSGITGPSTNTTAGAMTVGTGASLTFSGTGTVNASNIQGTPFSSTAPTTGQIPISNGTPQWVPQSISGDSTLTSAGVMKNTGIQGTPVSSTAPTTGQMLIANATPQWNPETISQDASVSATGVWTNLGINGTSCVSPPGSDCLLQYLLLNGRSGGQAAAGGTQASDSLTLKGTINGTPATTSNVQINSPFGVTSSNPSPTIAMVEFNAPNVTLTGNSQLVELYRGTTTIGSFATVRGLSPAHDCGANCGAHFTHQGPTDNGIELFTDDIHHWNQQNNSITTASTSYGEARTWVMDATAGHSPTFNLNDSLAHAVNFGNHQTRYDVNGSCTCSVNADCGTGGTCTGGKCTAGAGATCIDSAGFCNTGGGFKCTSPGTPTGTVQHDTGLQCGGPIAEIETGWTINHQTCIWHDSPAVVNGTLSDEIGMHLNLTKGTTRESLVSVDPGTIMQHAGGVEIGSSTTTPGVSNLAVTGTQTNTPLAKFDYTGSITTGPVALALFPAGLSVGAGGGMQGLVTGSTYTLTGSSSAFGLSNFFAFSPTIKNTTGTAETASGVASFFSNPTLEGDGAVFTNNTVIVDALDGFMFIPQFSTVNGGSVTADNVVGVHTKGNVNAGGSVTNFSALKVDNPALGGNGAITNLTAIDLASLTAGGTNISFRSAGAATMRHAGNVRIGDTATAPTHALEVTQAANTSPVAQFDETGSITAGMTGLRAFPAGLSLGSGAGGIDGLDTTSTWTMSADPSAIVLGQFVNFAPTITNSAAVHPKGYAVFKANPIFQANTNAITMASVGEDAFSGLTMSPTFNIVSGGTGTADTVTGVHAKATVSTGWTVTNYTPVKVDAPTVTGAITNLVGVDVAQLTQGTLNVGIRNAATTANPMAAQSFASSSTLVVNATFIGVTATAASLTITLPTTNINDGTRIVIINAGATNTFTLATIAQGNLTMAVAGAANSTAEVIWSSTLSKWLKLSQA